MRDEGIAEIERLILYLIVAICVILGTGVYIEYGL